MKIDYELLNDIIIAEDEDTEELTYFERMRIKKRIRTKLGKSKKPQLKIAVIAMVSFALIYAGIPTNVKASIQLLSKFILHDTENNATFEYKQSSSERVDIGREIESILSQYKSKMSVVASSLEPGEAVIFLIAEAYRIDRHYFPLQKDTLFTDIEQMSSRTPLQFTAPVEIHPSYRFSKGMMRYKISPVEHEQLERWYADTIASNLPYVVESVKLTDKVELVEFSYVDEKNPYTPVISVHISESSGFTSTSNLDKQAEIIHIGGKEIIYEPNHNALTFMLQRNETKTQYTILGNSFMTKQDFMLAAEKLIGHLKQIME